LNIGIPGWEQDGVFGVSSAYMAFASIVGNPIIIPVMSINETLGFIAEKVDGILLPGGSDVDPCRFGIPGYFTGKSNPYLEFFDANILPSLVMHKKPIFGICRGLQTLNVLFGGTLNQHLFFHPYSSHNLDMVHEVTTKNGEKFKTNSFHHQSIGKLSDKLVMESHAEDGVIESISHPTLPIFAVQWHPERCMDGYSINKFKSLFK
jgi:putative glutamine amidotransferase